MWSISTDISFFSLSNVRSTSILDRYKWLGTGFAVHGSRNKERISWGIFTKVRCLVSRLGFESPSIVIVSGFSGGPMERSVIIHSRAVKLAGPLFCGRD